MLHLSNSNDSYLVGTRTNSSPRHPRLTQRDGKVKVSAKKNTCNRTDQK